MFFLPCSYIVKSGRVFTEVELLGPNKYFGQECLLHEFLPPAGYTSLTFVDVHTIDKQVITQLLDSGLYPNVLVS